MIFVFNSLNFRYFNENLSGEKNKGTKLWWHGRRRVIVMIIMIIIVMIMIIIMIIITIYIYIYIYTYAYTYTYIIFLCR